MFIVGHILQGVVAVTDIILFMAQIMVIASVVISWVNADPRNQLVQIVNRLTLPLFHKVQKKIPTTYGNMDFTPFIILLIIIFIQSGILPSIQEIAYGMVRG